MRIVTLATCHNRRAKTLSALADLHSQELPESVSVEHVIVDDGSTDGTAEAVREQFPDVEIVPGSGGLFWAGGMRHGWENAAKNKEFDYLFVYNDDVRLELDALKRMLETSQNYMANSKLSAHAVVGAFRSPSDGAMSYGGLVRSSWWHPLQFQKVDPPEEGYKKVDTLNMNGCLITRSTLGRVGFLSAFFRHGGADYEYGLKLNKSGGEVVLTYGYVGWCERNHDKDHFIANSETLVESYRKLLGVKKQEPYQRMRYYLRHGGALWPLLWVSPYITLPVKYIYFRKLRNANNLNGRNH